MNFILLTPLPDLVPVIEIESNNNQLFDLHNDGVFKEFSFQCEKRKLVLKWDFFKEGVLSNKIDLEFLDVLSFEIKPRDSEIPFSEDDCLSHMIFDKLNNKFTLEFMNGQEFIIYCYELKLNMAK